MTTSLVQTVDIQPFSLTNADNLLFFLDIERTGIWQSDGTENGTSLFFRVPEGLSTPQTTSSLVGSRDVDNSTQSRVSNIGINGKVFFAALENETGEEPWVSDGTAEGTAILRDINLDGSSEPRDYTQVGDSLFFTAFDEENGRALWVSDGTTEGTQLVQDINTSSRIDNLTPSPFRGNFIDFNGTLFFTAIDSGNFGIYQSDGTEAGTQLVREFDDSNLANFTVVEDSLFFTQSTGQEEGIWQTDGTTEGTQLVADFQIQGPFGRLAGELTAVGDTLFFYATEDDLGAELWKSDGTPEGTQLVKDIRPEERVNGEAVNLSSDPQEFINVDGTLFFTADDGVTGRELWKSDGTAEGTQLVKDITEGEQGTLFSTSNNFTNVDGILYFTITGEEELELWQSDGTTEGTVKIEPEQIAVGGDDFNDSFRITGRSDLIEFNDQLFFTGDAFTLEDGNYVPALLTLSDVENEPGGNGTGNTVYRFFNNNAGVHFYTANEAERDAVQELDNFSFEGASYVGADPLTGEAETVPVYRFLNQDTGVHLFTISETERDAVQELDNFSFEGEAFFAYESEVEGSIPIYRFFNSTSGAHFYTPSAAERDNVEDNLSEFQSEGIAYYALPISE